MNGDRFLRTRGYDTVLDLSRTVLDDYVFIAILFIFPLMFKANMFHITLVRETIQIIANR
jgi:hypothetical protein